MKTLIAMAFVLSLAGAVQAEVTGLSKVFATEKAAGEQGSPLDAVETGLRLLKLKGNDVLLDPGCGDGRVIATAVVDYNCRALGIEIDAAQADVARKTVVQSDVEQRALVMLGDFTKHDFTLLGATKAYVYLYPDSLAQISKELAKLDRVVSYMHDIPGLKTKQVGDFYLYERLDEPAVVAKPAVEKPVVKQTRRVEGQRYADYGGRRYFTEYNRNCNCAMCQSIRYQLSQPRYVDVAEPAAAPTQQAVVVPQRTGRWVKQCINGVCQMVWVE